MTFRLAAFALLVALASGCAAPPRPPAVPASNPIADAFADMEQLKRQADAWDKAIVRKDQSAIEENMAEDFRQIDGSGSVETKASFVAGVMEPGLVIDPYTVEDFQVRLYGDIALLSGRTRITGNYEGKAINLHYRYIDIYARRDGRWRIISVQISTIPQ
jgi:ketosteroid isomerase-like protein